MMFDKEADIIDAVQSCLEDKQRVKLFTGNSFEKKVLKCLQDIGGLTDNSSHGQLPPDFFSDARSMMFDVMRVNDAEIKRTYNPIKIRERKLEKEIQTSGLLNIVNPDCKLVCMSESDDVQEHTFKKYCKNVQRVLKEHIKKCPIWVREHPNIKYKGLLVFDETECCFNGFINYAYADQFVFRYEPDNLILHEPWHDKDFVHIAYDSDLDFIVWFCPYKPFGVVLQQPGMIFPSVVIMDVRYNRTVPYKNYDGIEFVL